MQAISKPLWTPENTVFRCNACLPQLHEKSRIIALMPTSAVQFQRSGFCLILTLQCRDNIALIAPGYGRAEGAKCSEFIDCAHREICSTFQLAGSISK